MKFPPEFLDRINKILPAAEVDAYLELCTQPLPKVVRIKPEALGERQDWTLRPTAIPEAWFIDRDDQAQTPLGKTLEHFTGTIYSQSLSSMLPVVVLDPQPDEKVLDLCAAPGSKTTFLASRMQNTGLIVANEPSGTRAKKLAANLDRVGVSNTVTVQSDGTILNNFFDQEFDRILLDAPCSSEGYSRRDNQFFTKMWSLHSIHQNAKLQKRLIESAWQMLVPGGIMVYSTCTSAPEENEAVVQHLLDTFPGSVELLPAKLGSVPSHPGLTEWNQQIFAPDIAKHARRFYPHLRSDAWNSESFFVVKLHKIEPLKIAPAKKPLHTAEIKPYKKNHTAELVTRLAKQFGLPKTWPQLFTAGKVAFYEKQGELYLTTPAAMGFMSRNLFRRAGLKVQDKEGHLTTEFALKIAPHATQNVLDLNTEQTERWRQGYDLKITNESQNPTKAEEFTIGGSVLVRNQPHGLGWGKVMPGKIKNKLRRDLVF